MVVLWRAVFSLVTLFQNGTPYQVVHAAVLHGKPKATVGVSCSFGQARLATQPKVRKQISPRLLKSNACLLPKDSQGPCRRSLNSVAPNAHAKARVRFGSVGIGELTWTTRSVLFRKARRLLQHRRLLHLDFSADDSIHTGVVSVAPSYRDGQAQPYSLRNGR